jgi:predicted glutamine amidotransferase
MCLAIYEPAGKLTSDEALEAGWNANSDGGGYAFLHDGTVMVRKGYSKWKEFRAALAADRGVAKGSPFIIHFRIRSAGDKGMDNTHPFLTPHGAMIHNGTISGLADHNIGKSDTALFAEKYGDKLTLAALREHKEQWDEAMGYNKLVFLFRDGQHHIINEGSGHWDNGVWYSNLTFRPIRRTYNTGHYPHLLGGDD